MKTVLHITEAFGGGIQTALCSYARSTKDDPIHHNLLARLRPKDNTGMAIQSLFDEVKTVEGGLLAFYRAARHAVKEIQPDIIHLHSSFAGFLGRYLPKGNASIVYTPHCYAFERRDISDLMQNAYMRLEQLGLSRIDVVAGCSERECELALELGAKRAVHLNNYADLPSELINNKAEKSAPPPFNVVVVGRVSAQKDPGFLLETVRSLKAYPEYEQIHIRWLGGGDQEQEDALRKVGIEVTGMIPHQQVMQTLQNADLYLHAAAWEGMPLTLLEAARMQVPMILRIIGATQSLPYPYMVSSPETMAKQIVEFCRHPEHPDYQSALMLFNNDFSADKQRNTLLSIYEV
ncbi:capsular biosynthesis protein [Enterovibrio norvegicus FF-33]|uniref:glycosyltransferase family 4 protein n=1 Tax=Enterovibrio norvegicus TaxID=188144 RepID=UPI0003172A0B|nr:glycosyltransferase family 4 protein [Enterovibrio norvegicus]OEE70640.1 capsular biosynthesis protein [Enterovibrio norvegicus FF-33]